MIGAPCRSCFVLFPGHFGDLLVVLLGIYWGYLPLSLIPAGGFYIRERGTRTEYKIPGSMEDGVWKGPMGSFFLSLILSFFPPVNEPEIVDVARDHSLLQASVPTPHHLAMDQALDDPVRPLSLCFLVVLEN